MVARVIFPCGATGDMLLWLGDQCGRGSVREQGDVDGTERGVLFLGRHVVGC